MAKLSRKKGITSQILHIFIQDSSSTVGAGLTALVYNSASLACRYINAGAVLSGAITLEDITTLGTYQAPTANTNMRFKEVSSVSPSQGIYEIHIHNDWMNLSGGSLVIMLAGAANMAQFRLEIDLQADVNVTHLLGTAWLTPGVAGTPDVNAKLIGATAQTGNDIGADVNDILVDTAVIGALGAGLTAIPWNATWDAEVQSEAQDAITASALATAAICSETRLAELDAANLPTDIAARATPAQVNAEVLDVLNVDTFAEPGQEAPAATNTLVKKIGYLFKLLRNKITTTSTQINVFADDATTVDQKSTISDDATTFTRGEFGSGP